MSNIYILEPATFGKVLLETTVGDIEIELWAKETPLACRNFVQLCMEGYYVNTVFHRVVKDFIVQGGDPTGTGEGGESIYGKPFKDEIHTRLRFVRRGLVAMANAGRHDNGSQFFFTLAETPELDKKHTIFGKVVGNTLYNMLRLSECETNSKDRPSHQQKIIKTEVLVNPFDDIVPRKLPRRESKEKASKIKKSIVTAKAMKDFKLLSFGEEAEEEEGELESFSRATKAKSKSSHDLIDDPSLSVVPAVENIVSTKGSNDSETETKYQESKSRVGERQPASSGDVHVDSESETEETVTPESDEAINRRRIREEITQLKREIKAGKHNKAVTSEVQNAPTFEEKTPRTESIKEYDDSLTAYRVHQEQLVKATKAATRETDTLTAMKLFKEKLAAARFSGKDDNPTVEEFTAAKALDEENENDELEFDASWVNHKFTPSEDNKKKVIDANVFDLDRYEVFDPRNPRVKRRREESVKEAKAKRRKDTRDREAL